MWFQQFFRLIATLFKLCFYEISKLKSWKLNSWLKKDSNKSEIDKKQENSSTSTILNDKKEDEKHDN